MTAAEDEHYIELITRGIGYLELNGQRLALPAGTLLWHPPGYQTIGRHKSEAPYECLAIILRSTPQVTAPLPRINTFGREEEARRFSQRLLTDCQHTPYDGDLLIDFLISQLRWRAHIATLNPPQIIPKPLTRCVRFIERHFSTEIGIQTLCELADLSPSHLHALFRQYLQQSPHQVILDRRLKEARLLLASSDLAIALQLNNVALGIPSPIALE